MTKDKEELVTEAAISDYKGSPVLSIYEVKDGKVQPYPFSFGKKKAAMILKHIEEIKKFVGEE